MILEKALVEKKLVCPIVSLLHALLWHFYEIFTTESGKRAEKHM
jgi:hypothetical protein